MNISEYIWNYKYRAPRDRTIDDTFIRVASGIATNDIDYFEYLDVMRQGYFVPGGRILANAGLDTKATMANCFVMPQIEDSIDGIFEAVHKAAKTLRAGGGIGMDFSTLRPRGAAAKGINGTASGPVSFMKIWDATCSTIMSAGNRRGAMMGVLRCDHPDILEFINAKREKGNGLTNFNISVALTDEFMLGVTSKNNHDNKVLNALVDACYDSAEPGALFIDTINRNNKLNNIETIYATNPCGEQPLPPNGACILGSINIAKLYSDNKTNYLYDVARIATRFLDNVIDKSVYPLDEQWYEAATKRRIGLGVMGYASMLAMWGIKYGSDDAMCILGDVLERIAAGASEESDGKNSHLTCIAPTGTTAMFAGNVSSGIEPIFAHSYTRNIKQPDGSLEQVTVEDYSVKYGVKDWTTVNDLSIDDHIAVMEVAQRHVDGAVSKTVNCPVDTPKEEFKQAYITAWQKELKGITLYRPNDVTGEVLVSEKPKKATVDLNHRPGIVSGATYKIKTPASDHAMYVTINDLDGKPYEIFFNTKDVTSYQWVSALSRTISAIFRRASDSSFVSEELKAIFDPSGGWWQDGKYCPGLVAAIGNVIEGHISVDKPIEEVDTAKSQGARCPKCGNKTLTKSEGCENCLTCGYSKCG